jgi:hypothetical protein
MGLEPTTFCLGTIFGRFPAICSLSRLTVRIGKYHRMYAEFLLILCYYTGRYYQLFPASVTHSGTHLVHIS